jgi:hypothetical protein
MAAGAEGFLLPSMEKFNTLTTIGTLESLKVDASKLPPFEERKKQYQMLYLKSILGSEPSRPGS